MKTGGGGLARAPGLFGSSGYVCSVWRSAGIRARSLHKS
jgi:hypothetical protein